MSYILQFISYIVQFISYIVQFISYIVQFPPHHQRKPELYECVDKPSLSGPYKFDNSVSCFNVLQYDAYGDGVN